MKEYSISETQGIRLLARLDRLKIIDLLPGNRVTMHLARNFTWRHDGPIQRFFEAQVQHRFFESSFAASGELRLVVNGMLSDGSNRVLQQRMKRLVDEFESLMEEDRKLELRLRRGTTMVLAIRPWELNVSAQFRRDAILGDGVATGAGFHGFELAASISLGSKLSKKVLFVPCGKLAEHNHRNATDTVLSHEPNGDEK